MKVFLDDNILFSAANSRWLTRQLLDALEGFSAELMSSAYAWDEAERNVRGHYSEHLEELSKLKARLGWIDDKALAEGLFEMLPEKDRPVLTAAIRGACSHLLTGDFKHFGPFLGKNISGVKIVSQRLMAEELARL